MNRYAHSFVAACPNNGKRIRYYLTMDTDQLVMVEDIVEFCAKQEGYHEEIADRLAARFPGQQELKAHHHGVQITTTRGGAGA